MKCIILVLVLSSCGRDVPPLPASPPVNLAAKALAVLVPDAKCEPYFTGAGDQQLHSAVCDVPSKGRWYCLVSLGTVPLCTALLAQGQPEQAKAEPAPSKSKP